MPAHSSLLHTWEHLHKTMKRNLRDLLTSGSDASLQDVHLPLLYREMVARGSSAASILNITFKTRYDDRLPLVIRANATLLRLTVALMLDYVMDCHSSGVGYTKFEVDLVEKDGWDYVQFAALRAGVRKLEHEGDSIRTWYSQDEMEQFATRMDGYFNEEDKRSAEPRYVIGIPLIPGTQSTVADDRPETATSGLIQATAGATALVVDDSHISRILAAHWLSRHNITADVAERGGVALKNLASKHYDLVFMDYSMPGLNGIKTTEIARKRGFLETSFVVALDYDDGSEENWEDDFSAAGMHGYLPKPADPLKLNLLLLDLLPRLHRQGATGPALADELDSIDSARENLILSLSGVAELDAEIGLANMGQSVEIYAGMLHRFTAELEDYIEPLLTLPLDGAWAEVTVRLHVLREFFVGIGADDLAQKAASLAAKADKGGSSECMSRIQSYCDAMMRLRAKLIGLKTKKSQDSIPERNEQTTPQDVQTDLATLRQHLSLLHDACQSFRSTEAQTTADSLRAMVCDEDLADQIATICALVDTLDYHEAQERCARLLETITPSERDTVSVQ
ncbi:MAG: response regulator [Proteobacteria bacterium]|nr:response regulator [Pseudomonadota bacterium]